MERVNDKRGEEIDFVKTAPDLKRNGRLNVRDFGAKGDGVTDDTAAIHKAIQTALAGEIRWVFLPRGSYLVRRHPEFDVKFNQWGEPEGFMVIDDHHPTNSGAIVIHDRDLLLSGEEGTELLVDSPQENAIHIVGSNNIRISDLTIRYTRQLNVSGSIIARMERTASMSNWNPVRLIRWSRISANAVSAACAVSCRRITVPATAAGPNSAMPRFIRRLRR